ncbi:hypothetical protein YC2023_018513 [Brassica napus]
MYYFHNSGNMSGSKGEEALAEYKRALEVMSAKKAAPKKAALSDNEDEVQFIRSNKPENVALREQLEQREEEVCDLRCAAEIFDAEKTMAVSGAIVVARWELMREWLNHQTDSWDLEGALERYKMVKTSEAEYRVSLLLPSRESQ